MTSSESKSSSRYGSGVDYQMGSSTSKVESAKSSIMSSVEDIKEEASSKMAEIKERLDEAVTANPWAAVGASAGVGFLVGVLATGRGLRLGLITMVGRVLVGRLGFVAVNRALDSLSAKHNGNGHDREMEMSR